MSAADLLDRIHAEGGTAVLSGAYIRLIAPRPLSAGLMAEIHECRAELLSYLAGEDRDDEITQGMMVYDYKLSDHGPQGPWLTLLAPGCNLREARQGLKNQFGSRRVLAVRRHYSSTEATT